MHSCMSPGQFTQLYSPAGQLCPRPAQAALFKCADAGSLCRCLRSRTHRKQGRTSRVLALRTKALVNVEFNPALLLGLGVMSSGVVLYQLRQTRTAISRDTDLFISCICLCTGGILVFQGWRLDPLLLLCQLFTTTIALSYALEALQARQANASSQAAQQTRPSDPRARAAEPRVYESEDRGFELPAPTGRENFSQWAGGSEQPRWHDGSAWGQSRQRQEASWQASQGQVRSQDTYHGVQHGAEPDSGMDDGYGSTTRWRGQQEARQEAGQPESSYLNQSYRAGTETQEPLGPAAASPGDPPDERAAASGRHRRGKGQQQPHWKNESWSSQRDNSPVDAQEWDMYG